MLSQLRAIFQAVLCAALAATLVAQADERLNVLWITVDDMSCNSVGVLQTFIIGKHFIIPTMILFVGVLFGNLAYYGYQGRAWAKQILFWMFFIFTWHAFFALFWAKKYREVFGDSFEYVFGSVVIVFGFLLFKYVAANKILNLKVRSTITPHTN